MSWARTLHSPCPLPPRSRVFCAHPLTLLLKSPGGLQGTNGGLFLVISITLWSSDIVVLFSLFSPLPHHLSFFSCLLYLCSFIKCWEFYHILKIFFWTVIYIYRKKHRCQVFRLVSFHKLNSSMSAVPRTRNRHSHFPRSPYLSSLQPLPTTASHPRKLLLLFLMA